MVCWILLYLPSNLRRFFGFFGGWATPPPYSPCIHTSGCNVYLYSMYTGSFLCPFLDVSACVLDNGASSAVLSLGKEVSYSTGLVLVWFTVSDVLLSAFETYLFTCMYLV